MKKVSEINIQTPENLVEVLDNEGRTLLLMPLSYCVKKKLRRKVAIVMIENSENKFLLKKYKEKKSKKAALWDVSLYANVLANHSYEDSAREELHKEFGNLHIHLKERSQLTYISNNIPLFVSIFTTTKISEQEEKHSLNAKIFQENKEIMFASMEELKALIQHSPELFTSDLLWIVEQL